MFEVGGTEMKFPYELYRIYIGVLKNSFTLTQKKVSDAYVITMHHKDNHKEYIWLFPYRLIPPVYELKRSW